MHSSLVGSRADILFSRIGAIKPVGLPAAASTKYNLSDAPCLATLMCSKNVDDVWNFASDNANANEKIDYLSTCCVGLMAYATQALHSSLVGSRADIYFEEPAPSSRGLPAAAHFELWSTLSREREVSKWAIWLGVSTTDCWQHNNRFAQEWEKRELPLFVFAPLFAVIILLPSYLQAVN